MNYRNINNQNTKCKGYSNAGIKSLSSKNIPQLYSLYFQHVHKQIKPLDTVNTNVLKRTKSQRLKLLRFILRIGSAFCNQRLWENAVFTEITRSVRYDVNSPPPFFQTSYSEMHENINENNIMKSHVV